VESRQPLRINFGHRRDMRRTGYEVGHIPGGVHFNPIRFGRQKRTDVSAHDVAFESLMTRLGISNMRRVVP